MHARNPIASRRRSWAVLLVGLASLVWSAAPAGAADDRPSELPYDTPGPVPTLDPSYRMTSHQLVLITDQDLRPQTVKLEEGQLVAWLSYSPVVSKIVFEREVAKSMVCHSLVNFSIKDDELVSGDIRAGDVASFCQLKPGRYRYKVVRPNPGDRSLSAAKRLDGEIVVGAGAAPPAQGGAAKP
jgi:hypothetical protein